MSIESIVTQKVVMISEKDSVKEAAESMKNANVGAVVVVKDKEKDRTPIGIVTDRDLMTRLMTEEVKNRENSIASTMSKGLMTVQQGQGIYEVIHAMADRKVRRAPVVDKNNKVVGMVTVDDLLQLLGEELKLLTNLIHSQVEAA